MWFDFVFFFSSRRRHTRCYRDWSSDVCSSDLTRNAAHFGLAAEDSLGADLARDAGNFRGERTELIDHGVDGVLQLQDFAFDVDRDLLGKIAVGDRLGYVGDVAD